MDRRYAFQDQAPYTTPDCLNVWPIDVTTGRERGGVRPGVTLDAVRSVAPYAWTTGVYVDSGAAVEALFVTFSTGTFETTDLVNWTSRINTSTGTDFASCAVYKQVLYQAQAGAVTKQEHLVTGVEGTIDGSGTTGGAGVAVAAPEDCGVVVAHLDALWLAGDPANPQIITKSATGDATSWDTAVNSASGAWSNTGSEGGQIGHAITAAISHSGNVLLVGSARATYAIVGNPRNQGATRRVSSDMGPLTGTAWCKGQGPRGENNTYLFTTNGLAVIPQDGLSIDLLSKNKIPDELQGVDPANGDNVAVGFDPRWKGIHITVKPDSSDPINYFYHIDSDSYWPQSFLVPITLEDRVFQLYPTFVPAQTATKSAIAPISSTGDVYRFDSESTEEFDSWLDLGPIRLAGPTGEGYIANISASLADGSDNCNARLRAGDSIEQAFLQTSSAHTYTLSPWTEGFNYSQRPQLGGYAAYLEIYDISNERWILEEVVGDIGAGGMRRVG